MASKCKHPEKVCRNQTMYRSVAYCASTPCATYDKQSQTLTLDELRERNGKPVYIRMGDGSQFWAIVGIEDERIYLYSPDYCGDCPDEDFYAMYYDLDPDGHFGLHILGWIAYDHPEGE